MKRVVFIWIPKTAGTSLNACLNAPEILSINSFQENKKLIYNSKVVTFGHMAYQELLSKGFLNKEFDNESFKFCFVRNPYDRAVSLFHYLKKIKRISEEETFLAFCQYLRDNRIQNIGLYNSFDRSQCNPQYEWIKGVKMNFVGRFENLQQDSALILKQLNISTPLPQKNVSNRQSYRGYYCEQSKRIIKRYYKIDFRKFKYSSNQL